MSTRCHIRIREGKTSFSLYHHSDGYPEGVGLWLKNYLKKYNEKRIINSIDLGWSAKEIANEILKGEIKYERLSGFDKEHNPVYKETPDMDFELTSNLHGDENYVYLIDCKKKQLLCFSHNWDVPFSSTIKKKNIVDIPDE